MFGSGSTGFCWNGGDSHSNMFKARVMSTYDSGVSCYYNGHYWPGIGVFWTNGSAQYGGTYDDVEDTDMFNGIDKTKIDFQFFAR